MCRCQGAIKFHFNAYPALSQSKLETEMFGLVRKGLRVARNSLVAGLLATMPAQAAYSLAMIDNTGSGPVVDVAISIRGFLIDQTNRELANGRLLARLASNQEPGLFALLRGTVHDMPVAPTPTIMGTVPIEVAAINQTGRWRKLMHEDVSGVFGVNCTDHRAACATPLARSAAAAIARLSTSSDAVSVVRGVNSFVNRTLVYKDDPDLFQVTDHWATMAETARRGSGDCEEYALMKLAMLKLLGFSSAQLRLVLLRIPRLGRDHAVLVVDTGSGRYVLDNLVADVYLDTDNRGYVPLVSMMGNHNYIHGFKQNENRRIAKRAVLPATIQN
jgi:predicted transglutaminase-like cysteine proteinase